MENFVNEKLRMCMMAKTCQEDTWKLTSVDIAFSQKKHKYKTERYLVDDQCVAVTLSQKKHKCKNRIPGISAFDRKVKILRERLESLPVA